MLTPKDSLAIPSLTRLYRAGTVVPGDVVDAVLTRITNYAGDNVWIHLLPRETIIARADELTQIGDKDLPLYGIPFAIKDNIDFASHPTTAGCPAYSYNAEETAPAVQALIDAGAILVGKTNLDQFATGLVGTRTPYGACSSVFNPDYISGGSSSGSAVAVASGLVSFALGTDTAGSGRVPAAFNNIVGVKPSRGLLSTRGVVPACRSLDCVSILALSADDGMAVLEVAAQFDNADPYSRPGRVKCDNSDEPAFSAINVLIPNADQLEFFGDTGFESLFAEAVNRIQKLGGSIREIEFQPFFEAASLLYEGPWVAERYAAVGEFIDANPEEVHPVTRQIIADGKTPTAVDVFQAQYRLEELRRKTEAVWDQGQTVLMTPTAGTIYTHAEVEADPITLNLNLGHYTNYMNLLDLSGIVIPVGFDAKGLPFGVTLAAPAFHDRRLGHLGAILHHASKLKLGATEVAIPSP
ncbi:MAG: allophanate hydrolase [Rhodospirillales bacterium]